MVLVTGGRGGSGRTTLALDVAWSFAHAAHPGRVLLVDADTVNPDLDLLIGAIGSAGDLMPSARVDQVVLRLAELQVGRLRLDSCLWTDRSLGLQCLLAPADEESRQQVGREHLDYLMEHLLQPAFDVIVIDAGPITVPVTVSLRFWADWATLALIPIRPSESDLRATIRTLRFLESEAGIGRSGCCAVASIESARLGQTLRGQLAAEGVDLRTRPWSPRAAALARARHTPLAAVDRRIAASSIAMVDQLTRTSQRRSSHG